MLRIGVADDSALVRHAIERVLRRCGMTVVASAPDGGALLDAVADAPPDVVLADLCMPPSHRDEGLCLAAELDERHPEVAVVLLSQYVEPRLAGRLLERRVHGRGYLLKERLADPPAMTDAVTTVARGGAYVDRAVLDRLRSRAPGPGDCPEVRRIRALFE